MRHIGGCREAIRESEKLRRVNSQEESFTTVHADTVKRERGRAARRQATSCHWTFCLRDSETKEKCSDSARWSHFSNPRAFLSSLYTSITPMYGSFPACPSVGEWKRIHLLTIDSTVVPTQSPGPVNVSWKSDWMNGPLSKKQNGIRYLLQRMMSYWVLFLRLTLILIVWRGAMYTWVQYCRDQRRVLDPQQLELRVLISYQSLRIKLMSSEKAARLLNVPLLTTKILPLIMCVCCMLWYVAYACMPYVLMYMNAYVETCLKVHQWRSTEHGILHGC